MRGRGGDEDTAAGRPDRGDPGLDHRALLATARLLTGPGSAATELLVRALSRRPAGHDAALRALVGLHLGRWDRVTRGTGSVAAADTDPDAWWVSPADLAAARRLDDALDALGPAERTVLVLTTHAGLSLGEVRTVVPDAEDLLARAHAGLAGEVADPTDLPARLDALVAARPADPLDDDVLALRARAVRRGRRRRWAAAAVAVAALVAGTALVPRELDLRAEAPAAAVASRPPPAASATPVPADDGSFTQTPIRPTVAAPTGVLALPTRGSLAGDQAILDQLLVAASPMLAGSAVDTRRVLFAGDVDGQRFALVAGLDAFGVTQAWFWGRAGAAVSDLVGSGGSTGATTGSLAVVLGSPGVFVALTMPGDAVEVSVGISVDTAGAAVREWSRLDAPDGVLTAPASDAGSGARYRVLRDGQQVEVGEAWNWSGGPLPFGGPEETPPEPVRKSPGTVDPAAFGAAVWELLWPSGLTREDLQLTVLWSGELPTTSGPPADVVVLAAVLPNGAVLTTTAYSVTGNGYGSSGGCGSTGHPAGTDPATITVVARCDVWGGNSDDDLTSLVVTAPRELRSVSLGADDGGPSVPVLLEHGWAVVREADPGLTRVTAPAPGPVSRAGPGDLWDV